jgi:GT2 family glycosyltransferase
MVELDIIIPCFNNWRLTAGCIASIFKSNYPKENLNIIIVDNASSDFTEKLCTYLVYEKEPLTYLRQKENLNFLKGVNVGFAASKAPFVMLLNNDTILDKNCIPAMLKVLKENSSVGIAGALEFLPNGLPSKDKPFIYWNPKKLLDPILKPVSDVVKQLETGRDWVDVDLVGSACSIIKREVIEKVGVFDELFSPCHYEQEDYFLRTKLSGFKLAMCIDALFVHIVAATTSTDLPYYTKVCKENKEKFLKKWSKLDGRT